MKIKKTVLWGLSLAVGMTVIYSSCKRDSSDIVSKSEFSGEQYFSGLVFVEGPVAQKIPEYRDITSMVHAIGGEPGNQKITNFETSIISEIRQKNPGYFEKFKLDILSKDPVRVDKALFDASNIVTKATLIKGITANTNSEKAKDYVENALKANQEKFDVLMMDLKNGKINKDDLQKALQNIFPDSDINKLIVTSKNARTEDECLVVNVAFLVNLVFAINIGFETNVNIHFNINYHTNINKDVEVVSGHRLAPALSSERNSLKREQFIASIISNL